MKVFQKLVIPYGLFMVLFIAFPMVLIALYAFTKAGNDVVVIHFTLDNFVRFFDPVFLSILWQSLWLAFITTILCLLLGYPVAYVISRLDERLQFLLILLITTPMWINLLIRTYSWISILSNNGLLNSFLKMIGLGPLKIMYTDAAVLLGMVYNYLPFMIISIHTQLSKMDQSVIEASYDLGATWRQTFLRVILPLSVPGILTGITLVFLPAVSSFVIPQLLGGGNYMLIGNLIENQFGMAGNWNFGSAVSLIMALIILFSMWLTKKVDNQVGTEGNSRRQQYGTE